jgi:Cu/Ag efflux protein CusF
MMKVILSFSIAAVLALGTSACGGGTGDADNGSSSGSAGSAASGGTDAGTQSTGGSNAGTGTGATADGATAAGDVKEYTFHGTVKKVDAERQMITVDHEKIGDYMEAMTMPFKVADPAILDQVKVGDETHFTLRVAGDQALITKVQAGHEGEEGH